MHWTRDKFLSTDNIKITLMGMSGVGKTHLSNVLTKYGWKHYSADYMILKRHLEELILNEAAIEAKKNHFLRDLLETKSIKIESTANISNLSLMSIYMGMIGEPKQGGLKADEFRKRQNLYINAETCVMKEAINWIEENEISEPKSNLLIDSTGSFCEIPNSSIVSRLAQKSLIVYIKASNEDELFKRAIEYPKPIYYPEALLVTLIEEFLKKEGVQSIEKIGPDQFYRYALPQLFYTRIPKYENISEQYGCMISSDDVSSVRTEQDFLEVVIRNL